MSEDANAKSCAPAKAPCGSCPYRRDVPSGVWDESEYEKLPRYDQETPFQPASVFYCHQQDGRVCAGWAGVHDMDENLALRLAGAAESLSPEEIEAIRAYQTEVPLFASGADAAAHGLAEVMEPGPKAQQTIAKLVARQERRAHQGSSPSS